MKIIKLIVCTLISLNLLSQDFPCSNGIVTNPFGPPANPQTSLPELQHFLNTDYDWMGDNNLPDFEIYNMGEDGTSTYTMQHLFSSNNPHDLHSLPFDELDMWPADGWELITMNIGTFPDGTLHSSVGQGTAAPEIPYVVLYNKQRGVLRVFVNSLTGLDGHLFDAVKVTVRFTNPEQGELTGLLRHFDKYDTALDVPTKVVEVASLAPDPGSPATWSHVDLQMGYDPCTCLFKSNLELKFQFFDNMTIEGNIREIAVDIPLGDEDGNLVHTDFLAGVNFSDGHASAGTVIYSTMQGMLDDYSARLEQVMEHNEQVGIDNKKNRWKLAIVNTFKGLVGQGTKFIVGGFAKEFLKVGEIPELTNEEADQLVTLMNQQTNTVNFSTEWQYLENEINAIMPDAKVWPNQKKVTEQISKMLGSEFDKLFSGWKQKEKLKAPTKPMGMMSEGSFSGEITDVSAEIGPVLFNPGTYPFTNTDFPVEPENYPAYNEVLGTFALLESPKFIQEHLMEYQSVDDESINVNPRWTKKMKLKEPLKYFVNPNLPEHEIDIQASLVWKGNYEFSPSSLQTLLYIGNDPIELQEFDFLEILDDFQYQQFNLDINTSSEQNSLTDASYDIIESEEVEFKVATQFVPLDVLNEMVIGYDMIGPHLHQDLISGGLPINWSEFAESLETVFNVEPELYLKLNVTYVFDEPGQDGSQNTFNEILTYKVEDSQITSVSSIPDVPFNLLGVYEELNVPFDVHFDGIITNNPNDPDNIYQAYLQGDTYFISAVDLNISAQISTSSDINVVFLVQQEATISSFSLLGEDVRIISRDIWHESPTPAVTSEELFDYCSTGNYAANESAVANIVEDEKVSSRSNADKINHDAVKLFPNPVTNQVNIYAQDWIDGFEFIISDFSGKVVLRGSSNSSSYEIDVNKFTSGVYIIDVYSENNMIRNKFIKL